MNERFQKEFQLIQSLKDGTYRQPDLDETADFIRKVRANREAHSATRPPKAPPRITIGGTTAEKLRKAFDAFPGTYSLRSKPKLDDDVRPWLQGEFGCSAREAAVFGAMLMEHFFPPKPPKTTLVKTGADGIAAPDDPLRK